MSPEEREMLQKSLSLAEDNNKILHSMKRSQVVGHILNSIYWLLIIGSAIGAFYFLQPYLDQAKSLYNSASATLKSFNSK